MNDVAFKDVLALVGAASILLVIFYTVQVARRAQKSLAFRLKRTAVALLLYSLTATILLHLKYPGWEVVLASFVIGLTPKLFMPPPRRSRYIRASVRRQVLERDNDGKRLDSRRQHLDHIVPYAKGGDNTALNLRVAPKHYNQRRGAKMPGLLDVLGRRPKG